MDCYGVQQHAGDAIDRSLPKNVEYEFQAHLARCGPCRREIALEKLSKRMVQENVPWISTPRSIQAFVLESLRQNYKSNRINHTSWMAVLGSFGVAFPVFVGGLVALAFFLLVSARSGFVIPSNSARGGERHHSSILSELCALEGRPDATRDGVHHT